MNKPEVFKNAELGSVRVVMVEEVPYFVGKDVAEKAKEKVRKEKKANVQ